MDDQKRSALAVLLSIFVILIYSEYITGPYKQTQRAATSNPQVQTPPENNPSLIQGAVVTPSASVVPQVSQSLWSKTSPTKEELSSAKKVTIETKTLIAVINLLGGRIESLKLKDYKQILGHNELLELIAAGDVLPLGVVRPDGESDAKILYQLFLNDSNFSENSINISQDTTFTLKATLGSEELQKSITFHPDGFVFDVKLPEDKDLSLTWSKLLPLSDPEQRLNEKDVMIFSSDNHLKKIPVQNLTSEPQTLSKWISIADKYFTVSLLGISPTVTDAYKSNDTVTIKASSRELKGALKIFAGPKEYQELEKAGYSLERNVDLGFFSFLAHPILIILKSFNAFFGNFGLAIIAFTLLVKALFLPLTKVSFRSMKGMQDLQPEIVALRERIKDPTELNKEMMALYQKKGVNPLGGCFPIFLQIPVFFGLYSALLHAIEMRHSPFALWIYDLSAPERLLLWGIPIPIMILVLGASMFLQQVTNPSTITDPVQKKVFMMMPIMFTFMFIVFPMPSGLVLYWLTNNSISIVQQLYLKSHNGVGAGRATLLASVLIFTFGYVLTLI